LRAPPPHRYSALLLAGMLLAADAAFERALRLSLMQLVVTSLSRGLALPSHSTNTGLCDRRRASLSIHAGCFFAGPVRLEVGLVVQMAPQVLAWWCDYREFVVGLVLKQVDSSNRCNGLPGPLSKPSRAPALEPNGLVSVGEPAELTSVPGRDWDLSRQCGTRVPVVRLASPLGRGAFPGGGVSVLRLRSVVRR